MVAVVANRVFAMSMSELLDRENLVEDSGYQYHCELMHYVNRTARRVFCLEFIRDHSRDEIQSLINETPATTDWVFYFDKQPSDRVKQELVEEYER